MRRLRYLTEGRFTWFLDAIEEVKSGTATDDSALSFCPKAQKITGGQHMALSYKIHYMPVTLDHIGIATKSVPELTKLWTLLGLTKGVVESVPDQGVEVHFFELQGQAPHIELLNVVDPQGSVAKFIDKRGPGIHHISFNVGAGELDSLCVKLRNEGYKFTYENPRVGAQGMRINFIHPQSAGGILVELMEPTAAGKN